MRNTICEYCGNYTAPLDRKFNRRENECYPCMSKRISKRRGHQISRRLPMSTEDVMIDLRRVCVSPRGTFSERLEMAMDYVAALKSS